MHKVRFILVLLLFPLMHGSVAHSQQGSVQDSLPILSPGHPVEGLIAKKPHAYGLNLVAGQFLRLKGKGEGDDVWLRLIGPRGDTLQLTNTLMLSQAVQETGLYRLEIFRYPGDTLRISYKLWVDELLSPARYAARQDSLRNDPRVAWLAQHAIPMRSLAHDDDDFTDLEPLRVAIGDARVVLLGEESHMSGNTIRAMSRLIRFLHQEMGFDVMAFESGLYDMWKVWQLMQAGHDPGDAMRQGLGRVWSGAADFQPLARYLGQQAVGPHPLEVSGVDCQLGLSSHQLVSELRELVAREHLGEEGKNLVQGFWTTLSEFMADERVFSDSLTTRVQMDVLSDLRWLAERLADAGETRSAAEGRTLRMWAQVSRSLAEYMAFFRSDAYGDRRDLQMVRNLAWLAREYFPGRKIIVWAANVHVLRHWYRLSQNPAEKDSVRKKQEFWMGQGVWEAFGDRSFVIAATAYSGQFRWTAVPPSMGSFTVVSDQDPTFELEELLAATGLEQAVVPLRNLPPGGDWLRSPILSRPWVYRSVLTTWPDHADAILFMRAATPTTRIPR